MTRAVTQGVHNGLLRLTVLPGEPESLLDFDEHVTLRIRSEVEDSDKACAALGKLTIQAKGDECP